METITGRQIVETARTGLGTPFLPRGRDLKKGVDCGGIITVSARIQGVECATLEAAAFLRYYPRRVIDALERSDMIRVRESEMRAGDVVLFHISSPWSALIEHLGLITDVLPLTFIHASPPALKGRVIEEELGAPMYEPIPTPWSFFVAGVYRFPFVG